MGRQGIENKGEEGSELALLSSGKTVVCAHFLPADLEVEVVGAETLIGVGLTQELSAC